jgi:hypothetical protein
MTRRLFDRMFDGAEVLPESLETHRPKRLH